MADPALKIAVDVILWVIVTIPFVVLEFAATPDIPYQRGFYCDDESIRYPYKEDTITSAVLVVVSLFPMIASIFVIEWWLYKSCHDGQEKRFEPIYHRTKIGKFTTHPYLVALYSTIGPFAFGVSAVALLTNGAKFLIGRFRPHFISVCEPDWGHINCTGQYGEPLYVEDFVCLGTDEEKLTDARLSFPSGHASLSVYSFTYFAIYLQCRMVWNFSMLLRPFLQLLGLTFALMCGLSRVSDYKHHPTDILAGSVLGAIVAVLVTCAVSDLMHKRVVKITKLGDLPNSDSSYTTVVLPTSDSNNTTVRPNSDSYNATIPAVKSRKSSVSSELQHV